MAAPVFVRRTTQNTRTETNTSFTIPVCPVGTGGIPVGRVAVIAIGLENSSLLSTTYTDTRGNVWYRDTTTATSPHVVYLYSAYIQTALQEGDVLSVTTAGNPSKIGWIVGELNVLRHSSAHEWLDVAGVSALNNTANYTFNTPATNQANEIVVSVSELDIGPGSSSITAGTGYTLMGTNQGYGGITAFQIAMSYKIVAVSGVQTVGWNRSAGGAAAEGCAATYLGEPDTVIIPQVILM